MLKERGRYSIETTGKALCRKVRRVFTISLFRTVPHFHKNRKEVPRKERENDEIERRTKIREPLELREIYPSIQAGIGVGGSVNKSAFPVAFAFDGALGLNFLLRRGYTHRETGVGPEIGYTMMRHLSDGRYMSGGFFRAGAKLSRFLDSEKYFNLFGRASFLVGETAGQSARGVRSGIGMNLFPGGFEWLSPGISMEFAYQWVNVDEISPNGVHSLQFMFSIDSGLWGALLGSPGAF
jgi:hypothetical protein